MSVWRGSNRHGPRVRRLGARMNTVPDHEQLPLLLLSRDLRLAGRDLRLDSPDLDDEPVVEQLSLPGIDAPPARTPRRRPRTDSRPAKVPPADDPLLATFRRRMTAQVSIAGSSGPAVVGWCVPPRVALV